VTQNSGTGVWVSGNRRYKTRSRRNLEEISTSEAHTRIRLKLTQVTIVCLQERMVQMGGKIKWHFAKL